MALKEIEETVELNRKRTVYICDRCGKELSIPLHKCFICGDDVCDDCGVFLIDRRRDWINDSYWCCNRCWKIGEKHMRFIDAEEDKVLETVKVEIDAWKTEVTRNEQRNNTR